MRRIPFRFACAICLTALTLILALRAPPLAGPGVPHLPGAWAQPGRVVYSLADTWTGQPVSQPFWRLEWPAGHMPGGIGSGFLSGNYYTYVTDQTEHTLRVYEAARFIGTIGHQGRQPGEFRRPRDVAVLSSGNLVVSDTGNDRLQIVSGDGTPVRSWPVPDPQAVVVADYPTGARIYVVSRSAAELLVFDESKQLSSWPLPDLHSPEGLGHVSDRQVSGQPVAAILAIADPGRGKVVQVLDGVGAYGNVVASLAGVRAVGARRPSNLVFLGAPGVGIVPLNYVTFPGANVPFEDVLDLEMDGVGGLLATIMPPGLIDLGDAAALTERLLSGRGQLGAPRRIAVGDVALVSGQVPPLQAWRRDGTPDRLIVGLRTQPRLIKDVAAAGRYGYMLDDDGSLAKVDGADLLNLRPAPITGGSLPLAIAAHGDRLAMLDLNGQEVLILDADGGEIARWSISAGVFKGVIDIALSADHVALANVQRSEVEIWSVDGALLSTAKVPGTPGRVAFGPGGELFVLTGVGWVFMYDPTGQPLGAWPAGAPQDQPQDLALDEAGRLYIADGNDEVRVYAPDPDAVPLPPPPVGDAVCSAIGNKGADPEEIWIGETVGVDLVADGLCPVEHESADVVLAIDHSGSMSSTNKMPAAKEAAVLFVAQMDPLLTRIGLVGFNQQAVREQDLTSDGAALVGAIMALSPGGNTNLVDALQESWRQLRGGAARAGAGRVIVLMSDGRHTAQTPALTALAPLVQQVRDDGVLVFAIGFGTDADEETLRSMATDPSYYYYSPGPGRLSAIYRQIARRIEAAELFKSAVVSDFVPNNMTYLPGSASPFEPQLSPDGKVLTWQLAQVLEPGFRFSYRLRPEEVGYWPTNVEAYTDYVDSFGNPGRVPFPIPFVRVLGPTPTPTPTLTPTPSPTPRPVPLFLPLALKEECIPDRKHADVALVIDASSSMDGPKLAAAKAAAKVFVGLMALPADQVAVVAFDLEARLVSSLTGDALLLGQRIDSLTVARWTRIDHGLQVALAELGGERRHEDNTAVIVLLTDGIQYEEPETAQQVAQAARAGGVTIYAIGLGEDVDGAFLVALAGGATRYYFAPRPESLEAIYREVAQTIPCPAEDH